MHQQCTPGVAVSCGIFKNLFLDQRFQARNAAERLLQRLALLAQAVLLTLDFHLFQFGEIAQAQIQDGLSLNVGELETLHQDGLRLVLFTDNRDDFIDVQIGSEQAVENMQSIADDLQAMAETIFDRDFAKRDPLFE